MTDKRELGMKKKLLNRHGVCGLSKEMYPRNIIFACLKHKIKKMLNRK